MSLYKNCGCWKNCDCIFEFSVKSYVTNAINFSCAKILLPSVIWHCIIHSFALQFITSDFEIWISFLLWFGFYDCWLNEIRMQYCISAVNEITSFSTKAAFNYAASRTDRHLTRYCNNALDPNYLSAHDAVSPPVTSLIFVQQRHTRFSISQWANSIY